MVTNSESIVGRFSVEVELNNDEDLVRAKLGLILPEQIRRMKIDGVVDSGAARLVIPESVVRELGLQISDRVKVRYADGRTGERSVAERVRLTYGGRSGIFAAIVEPARDSALIGAIVLEDLDFVVDCRVQKLVPRDPNMIISEIE
ncbi:MAG TPA: retroviral-like aspartic protease family protein [Tepidisphaeraceae bacterium]|nr:retroviral-like aspartic protease family protein [Tepidisphaeraceae bacterium]